MTSAAETTLTAERIDRWAERIVDAGVGRLALFLVVSHLPLSTFAAHAALVLDPFVKAVFGLRAETFQALLADRDALARLAAGIEARLAAAETRHG